MIPYRPEIDGLRAVAVVPIVLFHAGLERLSGGYVGVDIFFVISGYLIGSIIRDDLDRGTFRFSDFYLRRMRRILPALLFMVCATLMAGWFVLLPDEWATLGRSAAASLLFLPNINFWLASSTYFGLDIATEPLLHTWSLGVEEQFYLLAPALLWLLHRRFNGRALLWPLAVLCGLSFWINLHWLPLDSRFSFYMLPARAFELIVGVMLACWLPQHGPGRRLGGSLALAGMALCVAPVLLLDEQSPFPGTNALYPVLGAALVIAGTRDAADGLVGRLLASAPLVAIGRISYSLYLWHWPVIVYLGLMRPDAPSNVPLAIIASVLLAIVSHRYVEERYRRPADARRNRHRRRELQGLTAAAASACLLVWLGDGFPQRIPAAAWTAAGEHATGAAYGSCETLAEDPSLEAVRCRLGAANVEPTVALWGDSHANALAPALDTALERTGRAGYLFFGSGCRPLLEVSRPGRTRCRRFNNVVSDLIAGDPLLKRIYLAGYWRLPLMGQSYDDARFIIEDAATLDHSPQENRAVFSRGLARTLHAIGARQAVLVEDIPEVGSQFGKSLSNHFVRRHWLELDRGEIERFERREEDAYAAAFEGLLASSFPGLEVLRVQETLCNTRSCPLTIDGELLYRDGDHLSEAGSLRLSQVFQRNIYDSKEDSKEDWKEDSGDEPGDDTGKAGSNPQRSPDFALRDTAREAGNAPDLGQRVQSRPSTSAMP